MGTPAVGSVAWFVELLSPIGEPQGLSPAELTEVATIATRPLPGAYRAFLAVAGRGCGPLWVGTEVFYPELLDVPRVTGEIAADGGFGLPPDALPIATHQGYLVEYLVGPGDDPAVYSHQEGDADARPIANSFTDHVAQAVARCRQRGEDEVEAREAIIGDVARMLRARLSSSPAGSGAGTWVSPVAALIDDLARGHLAAVPRFVDLQTSAAGLSSLRPDPPADILELEAKLLSDCEILLDLRRRRAR